jgi:hypothetical protein
MDLLATSPSLLLLEPIIKSFTEFTLLYKEAHKLKFVPLPTIKHKNLTSVLNKINGHEIRKTQILKDPTTNTSTEPTEKTCTTTTDSTTTNATEILPDTETTTSTITATSNNTYHHPTFARNPLLHQIILPPINLPLPMLIYVLDPFPHVEPDLDWDQHITQPSNNCTNNNIGFSYDQLSEDEETTKKENLLTMLQNFVKNAILVPLHTYHSAHTQTTTIKRIQLATTPSIVRTTAQRIAAAIQREPPVT